MSATYFLNSATWSGSGSLITVRIARFLVTLSAGVINLQVAPGDAIDSERLLADAEAAVGRAKQLGRNRVERVDGYSGVLRPERPAR